MEAKTLVGGKSANFALGGAVIISGFLGWIGYSAASSVMDWDSPGTIQDVAKTARQLLNDKTKEETAQLAPAIAPKEKSKLPEVTIYQYPANVAAPSASFKPDVAASNAGFQEAEKQHSEPRHETEKQVVKHSEKVATEKPKAEKHEATAKAKAHESEKPVASGNWVDDLMPGETKGAYQYEYVAAENGAGEKYRANGGEWKAGKGLGDSNKEMVAAITPDIKITVAKGGGSVAIPDKFKSDSDLWSDK